jgi:hypothetical protein
VGNDTASALAMLALMLLRDPESAWGDWQAEYTKLRPEDTSGGGCCWEGE